MECANPSMMTLATQEGEGTNLCVTLGYAWLLGGQGHLSSLGVYKTTPVFFFL